MGNNCTECPVLENALFQKFSSDQLSRFTCIFHPTQCRRNQVLFFEGTAADHIFSLRSGLVKMVKPLENGKERIIRMLLPGEIFGLETLADTTHSMNAVVLQDSDVCAVSRDHFFSFLQTNADIALEMVRFLVGELIKVRTGITTMSFKDARARVATFVLSLINAGEKGVPPHGNCAVTLPLSSQEIGDILELSPETVSRAWTALSKSGVLDKRGRRLVVRDFSALERAAHN